jgi:hypothetical protein
MRELRVARAQDDVGGGVDVELLLERRLHVDLGEHAETLRLQGRRGTSARVGEGGVLESLGDPVGDVEIHAAGHPSIVPAV